MTDRLCRVSAAIAFTLAMLLLAGCPNRTSIADINRNPGHFAGRDITIVGRASDSFGAMGHGIFAVDDGSGRMWVYSSTFGVPNNGNKIAVTGRIQQGFTFAGRSFGLVLRETERRR